MSSPTPNKPLLESVAKLSRLLANLAMYNNREYSAARSTQQQNLDRIRVQAEIDQLVATIGDGRFPPRLLSALKDGTAISDGTGKIEAEFSRCFR